MGHMTLVALIATMTAAAQAPAPPLPEAKPFPGTVVGNILTFRLRGASGIVYHPTRKTLFVADDWGEVYEMDLAGKRLNGGKPAGFVDSEGLTVNPATGLVYMVTEGTDSIIEIDPETLKRRRTFTIPRTVNGAVVLARSQPGLEGITFKPDPTHSEGGTFFVCNQGPLKSTNDIAAVFEVAAPLKTGGGKDGKATIVRYVRPGTDDLAGLHYDAARDRLYVITGTHHQLLEVTPAGKVLAVYTMPAETAGDQEGITFDAGDGVYVPLDGGGVVKLTWKRPAPTTQPAGAAGGAKGNE